MPLDDLLEHAHRNGLIKMKHEHNKSKEERMEGVEVSEEQEQTFYQPCGRTADDRVYT